MKKNAPTFSDVSNIRRDWSPEVTLGYVQDLEIWDEDTKVEQKFGGLQNRTYFATEPSGKRYAVRIGFDQYRTRQTSVVECTHAAHRLGLGPALVYSEPNLSVTEFVEGPRMEEDQMSDPDILRVVIDLMKKVHGGGHAVMETINYWWPFDTVRRYFRTMETGKAATGFRPSPWVDRIPQFETITDQLETVIAPYIPCFTHNDMGFGNMIFHEDGDLMLIDWDGGAYGHPMWDLGEMLMWADADEDRLVYALDLYYPGIDGTEQQQRLKEIKAFQVMATIRLITEVMETHLDPYYFLTPEEMSVSMGILLPGQRPELDGLVDLMTPRFEELWGRYKSELVG